MVSGVTLGSYWISNYVMDMLKHVIPAGFSMLMILAYGIETFTETDEVILILNNQFFIFSDK